MNEVSAALTACHLSTPAVAVGSSIEYELSSIR
jgi:hypothetical protein